MTGRRYSAGALVAGGCPYLAQREALSGALREILVAEWLYLESRVKLNCVPYSRDLDPADPLSFAGDDWRALFRAAEDAGIWGRP